MNILDKKLLRDMQQVKAQILAIALVVAAGIAVFVIMNGVNESLKLTQNTYYQRHDFADIFVSLKRAPESLKSRIEEIPGVDVVETRVKFPVTLQIENMLEPGSGIIISIPDFNEPALNKLYLRKGRYPNLGETNSVLVNEGFFMAHQLQLGDLISVIMNGTQRDLKVVGVALSPEFVYSIAPGAMMPDAKRFAIFWMKQRELETTINMKGAFNDVLIKKERNSVSAEIKSRLDLMLKPYGGLLAIDRKDQTSHFFLENEFKELKTMGNTVPVIFLLVAAFLINVVISRQIATQRVQIGMLKAVGFTNNEIIWHFLKLVLIIMIIGAILGLAIGTWSATGMINMYAEFFKFPVLKYSFSIKVMILAVFSCFTAAFLGAIFTFRKVSLLQPAESMRPETPENFKHSFIDRIIIDRWFSFLSRIIIRQIIRRPVRSILSTLGVSMAMAILVFSFQMGDTMNHMIDLQYQVAQREDLNLSFNEPKSSKAIEEIKAMPGILLVEQQRDVPVLFKHQHKSKRGVISGLIKNPQLKRVLDAELNPVEMPDSGLVINSMLAKQLAVMVGDILTIEVLDDKRHSFDVVVSATTEEFLGLGAYLPWQELSQYMDETPRVTGASLLIDYQHAALLYQKLKKIPAIMGINIVSVTRKNFEKIMAENLLKMMGIIVIFASFISVGVIYNTARIALSERGRELASLRVLGLTRKEVAYLLFGEMILMTIIAIPLGIWIGDAMAASLFASLESEVFRIPSYVTRKTYGQAALAIMVAVILSFYLVWRRVRSIDLVSAQKGVE